MVWLWYGSGPFDLRWRPCGNADDWMDGDFDLIDE
jgi:hypothetical protein